MKKVWPFWVTGTFWATVLLAVLVNGIFRSLNMPHIGIDLADFGSGLFVTTLVGLTFSIFRIKPGLVWMGICLILMGVSMLIPAYIDSSDSTTLVGFLGVSLATALLGASNLIALKA
jgi:hypothetical protein